MQERIFSVLASHEACIMEIERYLWAHPETGFRETESSAYLAKAFTALGYAIIPAEDIPGFIAVFDTGRPGPTVLVLAELDAILEAGHPEANPDTGAVHACGHHAQCAALYGVAAALTDPQITAPLCGKIKLCAVPAEEPIESEWREQLRANGNIRYTGGKREYLARGYFDDVDLALMVHLSTHFAVGRGAVGSMLRKVKFSGTAAHAGGAPQNGKNAFYAAVTATNAVNALRETLVGDNRAHLIMTAGGESVGSVPARAELACYLRASTLDSISALSHKLNGAFAGGALSLGCTCTTVDKLVFAPLVNDRTMVSLCLEAAKALDIPCYHTDIMTTGSTDMGDLCMLMPVVHPFAAGVTGETHGADYQISDPHTACVKNAAWQIAMLCLLLEENGKRATEIVAAYTPAFASAAEFLAYVDTCETITELVTYTDGGAAVTL